MLEAQEHECNATAVIKAETDSVSRNFFSSSEPDHSDSGQDYRRSVFGGANGKRVTLSPRSLSHDSFDSYSAPSGGMPPTASPTAPTTTSYPLWMTPPLIAPSISSSSTRPLVPWIWICSAGASWSPFRTIKPRMLSRHNPEAMMGDDSINYGYDDGPLPL
ncbi:hypothetical protein NKR23_g12396 [Pleurostoma richardsiae]|uniref:Uncharacterized protein n=1 Tax=Pleurostoma richardsiae TaxID=41990 RepID=A0AA38R9A3_9PEZI|nr:hypothetical protein NKR23_g12396 [Pleurostoma richardsiae]